MKTFTATQLNKSPQKVFAAAKEDGAVEIKHDRYPNVNFTIECNEIYTVGEELVFQSIEHVNEIANANLRKPFYED